MYGVLGYSACMIIIFFAPSCRSFCLFLLERRERKRVRGSGEIEKGVCSVFIHLPFFSGRSTCEENTNCTKNHDDIRFHHQQ
ncbi:MAG: hypothetical protein J3R72DRAFT_435263 [Linnemannia gamsii]|nr:MAG: hypothetical protein J3R72DRAFT_435263 [Linnemannia gamsii]